MFYVSKGNRFLTFIILFVAFFFFFVFFFCFSTRRFILSLALCYFALMFFSPLRIAITLLGEKRASLSAFRTFVRFALV